MTTPAAPEVPPETEPTLRPAKDRRLKAFLIASVALNLLVLGAMAGAMAFRPHGPLRGGGRGIDDFGLMQFSRELPPDRRKDLRREMKEARARLKPFAKQFDDARADAAGKLAAETFDRAEFKAAVGQVFEKEMSLKGEALDLFIATVEKLTPDERRRLSEWWKKRRFRGKADAERPQQ